MLWRTPSTCGWAHNRAVSALPGKVDGVNVRPLESHGSCDESHQYPYQSYCHHASDGQGDGGDGVCMDGEDDIH